MANEAGIQKLLQDLELQRKELELQNEELRQSEDRYKSLFQNNHSVMLVVDPDNGQIMDANLAASNYYGWTNADICQKNISDINTLSLKDIKAEMSLAIAENRKHFLFKHKLSDGRVRDVEVFSGPISYHGKTFLYSIIHDITESKQAEIEKTNQSNILSNLIINLHEGILLEDSERKIVLTNQLFCDMFGIPAPPELLVGGDCSESAEQSKGMFKNPVKFVAEIDIILTEKVPVFNDQLVLNDGRFFERDYIPTYLNGNYSGHLWRYRDVTERQQAQLKLANSEKRFSQVVEKTQEVVWEVDVDGLYTYVSPLAFQIYGYTPDEMVGKMHFYDIFPAEHREELKEMAFGVFRELGEFNNFTNTIVKANGEYCILTTSGIPNIGPDGNLEGYRGLDADITERTKIEDNLIKLSQAVEQSPIMTIIADLNGDIEYANPKALDLTGYPLDELIGKNPRIFQSGRKPREEYEELWQTIGSGNVWKGEFLNKKKNGHSFWVSSIISPVISDGKITHYIAIQEDITDRKIADEKVRQQNEQLNAIISAVPDLIFVINGEGLYTELDSTSRDKFYETDSADFHLKYVQECISTKKIVTYEFSESSSSEVSYFEARMAPLGPDEVLTFIRDITDRKRSEKEIVDLNANLEKNIEERTRQLAESEFNYRTVVENVKEVIFTTDINGLWLFLNKAWEELTGYTTGESIGKLFLDFVHPDDRQRNTDLFTPLINREKEYSRHSVRYLTKDGGFRWVEVFARLGLNDRDEITGTYGTLKDITERKRAQDFEDELLALSLQLTGVAGPEISAALDLSLKRIGSFLEADRAHLFEFDPAGETMSNTHEWCNEGVTPEIGNMQNIPNEVLPMWMSKLRNHENIIIYSVKDLPDTWIAEREILEAQAIQSLAVIPVSIEGSLIGFVGLDSVLKQKEYQASEINMLMVWSNTLASLVNNERKELLLDQTRRNYETFFNTIDDFLFVLDNSGNIIHTNKSVIERLGYNAEELVEQSVLMVHPEERRAEAGRIVGEMLAGTADFCPVPLITKSGHFIPVETRVKLGHWDGKPAIFGVSKDISQIKLSEEKFSKAFQSNAALMAISGFEDGMFRDVNETFLKTLGFSRDEIIGKTSNSLNLFPDHAIRNNIARKIKEKVAIRDVEVEVLKKDGSLMTGLFSADLILIGNDLCFLTMMVDITDRIRAEEEIRQARAAAEKADLSKSEFLSRMSHELRTPLNSILGFAQLLDMAELNPGQKKGVGHIMRSGKHLLKMINEVLEISRIEAGRLSLNLEPIQIKSVIGEMLDTVQPLAEKRNIVLKMVTTSANQLYVTADRQLVNQVLLNLLNNGIKYNNEGGSVSVSTVQMPVDCAGITYVRINISDSGKGISEKNLSKVFNPFERIGAEISETEGSGLGLAVAKKLIDNMGGNIGVESEPGVGSTFWIELPLCDPPKVLNEKSEDITVVESGFATKTGTILYIEDDISNIELVEEIIGNQCPGIRLITKMNGEKVVDITMEYEPDLILLDLNLPGIPGAEILKLLLDEEETRTIPVVIVSADAMPQQVEKMLNAGARRFLTKPLNVIEFLKVIDEYVIGRAK